MKQKYWSYIREIGHVLRTIFQYESQQITRVTFMCRVDNISYHLAYGNVEIIYYPKNKVVIDKHFRF